MGALMSAARAVGVVHSPNEGARWYFFTMACIDQQELPISRYRGTPEDLSWALVAAAAYARPETARLLVDLHGCDINAQPCGMTALQGLMSGWFLRNQHQMLRFLCRELGADVNAHDYYGHSALHYSWHYPELVEDLGAMVECGADVNLEDFCGLPPWCFSHRVKPPDYLHLLARFAWEAGSEVSFVRDLDNCREFTIPERGSPEAVWLEAHGRVRYRRRVWASCIIPTGLLGRYPLMDGHRWKYISCIPSRRQGPPCSSSAQWRRPQPRPLPPLRYPPHAEKPQLPEDVHKHGPTRHG